MNSKEKESPERERENKVWDIVALSEVVIVLLVVSSGNNEKKIEIYSYGLDCNGRLGCKQKLLATRNHIQLKMLLSYRQEMEFIYICVLYKNTDVCMYIHIFEYIQLGLK